MADKPHPDPLARAAEETLKRIRRDRRRAPARLRPLIACIEAHLFESTFNVNALRKACGVKSNNTMMALGEVLGATPHQYITDRRLEVAAKLLRDTHLRVRDVAARVGYDDERTFSRAFKRAYTKPPSDYRKAKRRELGSALVTRDLHSLETARLALAGKLARHEAVALIALLKQVYSLDGDAADPDTPAVGVQINGPRFERFQAGEIWAAIEDKPPAVQLATVRREGGFSTPALFELLREKSREAGRVDRRHGLHVAELAIASLDSSAQSLGAAVADLRARGWAWLGNVRRQANDFSGAEDALALAEEAWATPRPVKDPVAEGEILLYRACLRLYQRRFENARELIDQAALVFTASDENLLRAQTLIVRSNINSSTGSPSEAVTDLHEAIELLDGCKDDFVLLAAYSNLAGAYSLVGRHRSAARALLTAKKLCCKHESKLVKCQLRWIEARIRAQDGEVKASESLLRNAYSGFASIDESDYAAIAALDLANLYKRQGREREASALTSKAIPELESLNIPHEVVRFVAGA